MKIIGYRTLKTAIGAPVAMTIAHQIGLRNYLAAGVITILSIQSTRKQSVELAAKRVISSIVAFIIAGVLFSLFGFSEVIFGLFILIFITVSSKLNLLEGVVASSVLVTHLMADKSTGINSVSNALSLMAIGVGTALFMNLYMPSVEERLIKDKKDIEKIMKEILLEMSVALKEHYISLDLEVMFKDLKEKLDTGARRAEKRRGNYLFTQGDNYYVEYMKIRQNQYSVLERMMGHFRRFFMTYDQTLLISELTKEIALSIGDESYEKEIVDKMKNLRASFKELDLPKTREEFENRAMLYQFFNDLEYFIALKVEGFR